MSDGEDVLTRQIELLRTFVDEGTDGPLFAATFIAIRHENPGAAFEQSWELGQLFDEILYDILNYGEADDARRPEEYDAEQLREILRGRLAELDGLIAE